MKYVCLGFVICLNLLLAPVALIAGAPPQLGEPMVVVVSPWGDVDAADVIAMAGGQVVGPEQPLLASVAIYDDPVFLDRLEANGAIFVLGLAGLGAICNAAGVSS
jgi:hypothetical protein